MGRFVNPDNSAFQAALNSRIYVDKTGLIACMNECIWIRQMRIFATAAHVGLENHMRRICLQRIIAKVRSSEEMFSELEIGKTEDFKRHLNKYDVIHIDIQWFLTNCDDNG